jgi:arginase
MAIDSISMRQPLGVIGVPTSAGAFAPGQEDAPARLREAGLIELLRDSAVDVRDHGDREPWRWRPDRERPRAQNLDKVVEIVSDTARRVEESALANEATLVLGGDCTVGIGTVAGHQGTGERVGLVYFDAHADLNIPESVREGALDWMGMAHMLGLPGTERALVEAGSKAPLLEAEQVVLFGWDPVQATEHEPRAIERQSIDVIPLAQVAADPPAAAKRALELLEDRADRVLVHFDVDVIDFVDVPLSENPGRNEGLAYADAVGALEALLGSPRVAGLTVTELNPAHVEEGAGSIERLARDVAGAIGDDR